MACDKNATRYISTLVSTPARCLQDTSERLRKKLSRIQSQKERQRGLNNFKQARQWNELSNSVIEISDDSLVETSSHVLNKRNMSDLPQSKSLGEVDNSIIDISDSSIELLQSAGTIPKSFAPKTAGSARLFVDLGDYNSELDNTLPELRLARYAHTSARPNKPKTNPSHSARAMSTSFGSSRSAIVKKITAQTLVQRLSDEFNADSISRLLMCVCCNLKWTTRKSMSQKLTHFKTCAKKHGVQDDTLVDLIRKGIINLPAVQPKGKGTSIVVDDASPKTFFDEVMHDAAPKKRTRRQEVKSTVKDIAEMRNAILLKARAIVAKGDSDVRALREHGTGEHSDSDLSINFVLSSTPRFAKSSLASRSGLQARYMFYNDGGTHESPPSSPNTAFSPFSPPIQQLPPSPPISSSGMGEVLQPLMDIDVHNLHTLSNNKYPTESGYPEDLEDFRNSQLAPAHPFSSKSHFIDFLCHTTALRKKPAIKEKIVIDAAWAEDIRNKIMKDTTLHLRILRLEPIHFDVFLSKIEGQDQQPSAKLKHHLREFLDKQAINFYGAEPVGRQRR
ncbi:protein [Lentinula edodes]|uniref:Protein n=1 Tax=Lentinula edodes TaxID=5353 RepID=A0A1Q3DVD5_LENED|nr:protein [Lentinula edodes]